MQNPGRLLWQRLEHQLTPLVAAFPGAAGVAVKDLTTGDSLALNADTVFPTASTIKIHVLTQLLTRAERGELDLNQMLHLTPELRIPGSGVITYLEGELSLSLLNVAILMITVSDNTATNICIDLAGIDATNALLRSLGFEQTTLRRKMQDPGAITRNDENVATPAECVAMLEALYAGRPSPAVAERVLSILKKWKSGILNRALPPDIPVANKPGGMERVRCDAGIVYLPGRPYAVCVMTSFAQCEPPDQEHFIISVARQVHQTMVALATTNAYGLGLPRGQ